MVPFGIYIHVPFCQVRCGYCDFNTYSGLGHLTEQYVTALCAEIRGWRTFHVGGGPAPAVQAATIFFGGGTPSLLSLPHVERILAACRDAFTLQADAEITIEANPGTVTQEQFVGLRGLGINRLSLGVQSFDDAVLKALDRLHNAEEARAAYRMARRAGFDNISLDFMYGLPGQSLAHWRATLAQAGDLMPDHLSLYALTLESHVPMARRAAAGLISLPDDDAMADMYTAAEDDLEAAGYRHYEISNWVNRQPPGGGPQRPARHNLTYWRAEPYLGFGPGAHSFDGRRRYSNVLHPRHYIRRISEGRSATAQSETISAQQAMGETMFLRLRLLDEGVSAADFAARHGTPLAVFQPQLDELARLGLLVQENGRLLLSRRGRLLSNEVFVRFVS